MSTINPVNNTASALAHVSSNKELMSSTQDQFLTLLVTQLRNQDPLNPMDNAAVTSQIAQLSTVNGINQLNTTLLALSGQLDMSQSMQAANLIGKEVLVPGEKIALGSNTVDGETNKVATPYGVDLISPAHEVVVTIMDSSGNAVRQFEMGPQSVGVYTLNWDGKNNDGVQLADGAYSVKVHATDADGNRVPAEALTSGTVGSVAYSAQGLQLDMGLAGKYSLFDVRKIM